MVGAAGSGEQRQGWGGVHWQRRQANKRLAAVPHSSSSTVQCCLYCPVPHLQDADDQEEPAPSRHLVLQLLLAVANRVRWGGKVVQGGRLSLSLPVANAPGLASSVCDCAAPSRPNHQLRLVGWATLLPARTPTARYEPPPPPQPAPPPQNPGHLPQRAHSACVKSGSFSCSYLTRSSTVLP